MAVSSQTLDYQTALDFLCRRIDYERNATVPPRLQGLHLERMRALLDRLDNPHQRLQIVHVAGTKGKGSTAAILSSILTAAGYRIGLYTSPHLQVLEERMVVDGVPCQPDELVDLVDDTRSVIRELDLAANNHRWGKGPTFFEITTALAWQHFVRKSVDLAVVEVGMGGRLDSTNVCCPLVSVITSISFDHTRQLGNSLTSIAQEKAGIIKPGVPVVSGVTQPEPRAVLQDIARQRGCALFEIGRSFSYRYRRPNDLGPATFDFCDQLEADSSVDLPDLQLRLLGEHQAANAAVALATLGRLQTLGWAVSESHIRQGLLRTHCPARVEVAADAPKIIVDTAHNHASIDALLKSLREITVSGRRILIFAATRDKDIRHMLAQLLPQFDQVVLTQYRNNPRSARVEDVKQLADEFLAQNGQSSATEDQLTACPTPKEALQLAKRIAGPEDLICVTGSFFLAGEIRPLIHKSRD